MGQIFLKLERRLVILVAGQIRPADSGFTVADQKVVLLADFVVNHAENSDLGQKINLHLFGCPGFV